MDENQEELSRRAVLEILYRNLEPVCFKNPDKILDRSKYVRLAKKRQYQNYRLCKYSDIINLGLKPYFSNYQKRFIQSRGAVLAIFNTINKHPISLVFRSIEEKDFIDYSDIGLFYGLDMFPEDFKYGDTVIITEGIYDADVLRQVYPNTLAMLTSNVSLSQKEILETITNHFIIAFDSDKAGQSGTKIARKKLGWNNTQQLSIFGKDKDVGQIEEQVSKEERYKRIEYYSEQIEDFITKFNLYL